MNGDLVRQMSSSWEFQYCQKLVVLSEDMESVLLACRRGEADYDGVYSFIGGKMDTTDGSLLAGMGREKTEEIGPNASVLVHPTISNNTFYRKKNGSAMVLPHIPALFNGGEIEMNEEYSDYKWVKLKDLESFKNKIENITEITLWAIEILKSTDRSTLIEI